MASNKATATSSSRATRGSIHTPLQPASVQDLKAKFDPGKTGDGSGVSDNVAATSTKNIRGKAFSPPSERASHGGTLAVTTSSSSRTTSNVTLSSLSSSLQAAANRKIESVNSSSSSSSSTSNLRTTSKASTLSLTTARPFSPPSLSSSKSGSASSSGRSSPTLDNFSRLTSSSSTVSSAANKWEVKSSTKSTRNSDIISRTEATSHPKDGLVDLPVMHISKSGSEVTVEIKPRSSTLNNNLHSQNEIKTKSSNTDKNISGLKSAFGTKPSSTTTTKSAIKAERSFSTEDNSHGQRTNRLVAREIKIERLDSGACVTSYKDGSSGEAGKSSSEAKTSSTTANREAKSKTLAAEQPPKDCPQPEFFQVKLRKTKAEQTGNGSKPSSARDQTKTKSSDLDDKRISRKISSERFERLMVDFQRGVPTETIDRRGSETDHLVLQQKVRELAKSPGNDDVPIIVKKKKETSIFTEGLKVSDFVKQVNKMNPDSEGPPKWKVQRAQSQTSSTASSDVGGDHFYQGIPGEDFGNVSDEGDDIYEQVPNRDLAASDGELREFTKAPGRRLGVYSHMKNFTNNAIRKVLKPKGNKSKTEKSKSSKSDTISGNEKRRAHSDGGGGGDNSDYSSSGTEYEDLGPDEQDLSDKGGECVYEDLESFSKPASESAMNKTITHKLKNIFYKSGGKNKKNKPCDSGVSAGTESDADTIDDGDECDSDAIETFSRTSSERSSSRHDKGILNGTTTNTSSSATTTSAPATDEPPPTLHNLQPVVPPLPPRTTKSLNQPVENSPPLPPRNAVLSNKATLGNPPEHIPPVSPTGKASAQADKTKDRHSTGGIIDGHDGGGGTLATAAAVSGKTEHTDSDPTSGQEKFERTNSSRKRKSLFGRKNANSNRPSSAATTVSSSSSSSSSSAGASSYIYPDINAFPELKGDDDTLYVDLEDEQIYGKASDFFVSKFESEPLYQWYSKDKVIQNMRSDKSTSDDLSSDDLTSEDLASDDDYLEDRRNPESLYEDVERLLEKTGNGITSKIHGKNEDSKTAIGSGISAKDKPQRRSVIEDVFKNGGSLHRALWCQMPEVVESGLLEKLTEQQKKLQEAMFEIMTSEASYLKSLKVLISVFLTAPEFSAESTDKCVLNRRDRQKLFSNIGHIKDISESFLKDLEERWQDSYYMKDVCDIIYKHASQNFEPYVRYCSNQAFQDRALNELRLNLEFNEAVKKLEHHPDCQFLPLGSFLLLPMQRITRLPLLVDAICIRLEPSNPAHASAKRAMDSLTKLVKRCDDAAKKMQQTEQMCMLKSNLEFKVKEFPLISASRFLVKQGELTQIKVEGAGRKPLSKLLGSNKEHISLFLFNDILLVTKKKGTSFQVRDYCQRNALHLEAVDNPDKTRHIAPGAATGIPNILFLAMLANHENKQVEMVLSCKSESERTRWIDAIMPSQTSSDSERIYDCWDCPQFHCVRKYIGQQPDELTLEESDVVNVFRKMADGWYEGERIRDGERGWFPASHTEEINNSHVRARNLRLRYRLMRASQEYSQSELFKTSR